MPHQRGPCTVGGLGFADHADILPEDEFLVFAKFRVGRARDGADALERIGGTGFGQAFIDKAFRAVGIERGPAFVHDTDQSAGFGKVIKVVFCRVDGNGRLRFCGIRWCPAPDKIRIRVGGERRSFSERVFSSAGCTRFGNQQKFARPGWRFGIPAGASLQQRPCV